MKHRCVLALLLSLALLLAPLHAFASTFNLSSLTDDELIALQADLEAELSARGLMSSASYDASVALYDPLVWVPKSGSKYHSKSTCSGMKKPHQVKLSEAVSCGFTPCKKCNPPIQ